MFFPPEDKNKIYLSFVLNYLLFLRPLTPFRVPWPPLASVVP